MAGIAATNGPTGRTAVWHAQCACATNPESAGLSAGLLLGSGELVRKGVEVIETGPPANAESGTISVNRTTIAMAPATTARQRRWFVFARSVLRNAMVRSE